MLLFELATALIFKLLGFLMIFKAAVKADDPPVEPLGCINYEFILSLLLGLYVEFKVFIFSS